MVQLRHGYLLPTTTILCHSMGGLVATPFYGSATHMQRSYKGEDPLNLLYGATTLAKITGSFPGPYIFLFVDKKTYDRNAAKLEVGRYPVRDADNEHMTADPFNLIHFSLYPPYVSRDYLIKAKRLYKTIAKVELNRTMPHTILLRNNTAGALRILPVMNEKTAPPCRWRRGIPLRLPCNCLK